MMQTFDENVDADKTFTRLARSKGKRGYIAP
jgi:predicted DNA-binding WGR domain protein